MHCSDAALEGKPRGDSIGITMVCEGVKRAELKHLPAVGAFYFRSKTFSLADGAQMTLFIG